MSNPNTPFAKFKAGAVPGAQPPPARPAQAAPAAQTYAPGPVRSKYSGVKASAGRYPFPAPGQYVLRVLKTYETKNPRTGEWYHADFEVVESNQPIHPAGSMVSYLQGISGKSESSGPPRVKSFVMAASGFDNEFDFDAMDNGGQFIDATAGRTGGVFPDGSPIPANPIDGQLVRVTVSDGNPVPNKPGQFYKEYAWEPIAQPETGTAN